MGTKPWQESNGQDRDYVLSNPLHPATYISWNDVQAFIAKLNDAGSAVYRLPTEAEWEYACRAGSSEAWSFGDDEDLLKYYAWYESNNEGYPQAVGTKWPNRWGLYDMHGNVREWVGDWYGPYDEDGDINSLDPSFTPKLQVDPKGPSSGSSHVFRGGGFEAEARQLWSANRDSDDFFDSLSLWGWGVGVRLVREDP